MGLTVGIDLGTTYSVIAYINPLTNSPEIIKNEHGFSTTPSAVMFDRNGKVTIGEEAKIEQEMGNPDTASFYKLEMGHESYSVRLAGKDYNACDLSAAFLKELIAQAEKRVGQKIENAVITVPAYFEDLERNNTIKAAEKAGLNVLGIINEPTAAAIAYGLKNQTEMKNILIYDLGGGTFDVTIAEVTESEIVVKGSSGKHFLGGKNWDEAIVNWVAEQFEEEFCESFTADAESFNACMVKAEKAKRTISTASYSDITFEYNGNTGRYRLTNEIFEECTIDLLDITKNTIEYLLRDVSLTWKDIDGVILVGGSTKMRMVSEYIKKMTGRPPLYGVHPDEAVAIGAAIHAESITRKKAARMLGGFSGKPKKMLPGEKEIRDVMAHSLGMISISADGERFVNDIMIKRNTPLSDASVTKRRELRVSRNEKKNELEIYLLQGEMECPLECTVAKKYVFDEISYVDGGKTFMDIRYYYTQNGTIAIEATQVETRKKLRCREEKVPEDMSWVMRKPEEYFRETTEPTPLSGVIYMALDVSGSMCGYPMKTAKRAMADFVKKFSETDIQIGIVAFADRVEVVQNATSDYKKIMEAVANVDRANVGGGTSANPFPAMYKGMKKFEGEPFVYALVLTDGQWYGKAPKDAIDQKPDFVRAGFEIIALGFGTADETFIRKISTRSDFAKVEDISRLDEKLSKIARIIQG